MLSVDFMLWCGYREASIARPALTIAQNRSASVNSRGTRRFKKKIQTACSTVGEKYGKSGSQVAPHSSFMPRAETPKTVD